MKDKGRSTMNYAVIGLLVVLIIISGVALTRTLESEGTGSQEKTLTLWHTYSPYEAENAKVLIDEFESNNPNVNVKLQGVPYGQMRQKLINSVAAGNPPDMVRMDIIWTAEFGDMGALLNIENYMEQAGISSEDFYPGPWSTVTWKGEPYGFPLDTNTRVLAYRKSLFEEEGISEAPDTWSEFLSAAKKLTKDTNGDGVIDQWGFSMGGAWPWHFDPFLWQAGGSETDDAITKSTINNEAGVRALQFLVDMAHKWEVMSSSPSAWSGAYNKFARGEVAMIHAGPWVKGIVKGSNPDAWEDTGLAVMPENKEPGSVVGGQNLVIFRQVDHPDAAWELMEFMTSQEYQHRMAEIGIMPTLKEVGKSPVAQEDPLLSTFMKQMKTARSRPANPEYGKMKSITHNYIEAALIGDMEPKEALDHIASRVNTLLE